MELINKIEFLLLNLKKNNQKYGYNLTEYEIIKYQESIAEVQKKYKEIRQFLKKIDTVPQKNILFLKKLHILYQELNFHLSHLEDFLAIAWTEFVKENKK